MATSSSGRKMGGKNRGFFYRAGRGWHANDEGRFVLLRDSQGEPLRDPKMPGKLVREAYARWLVDRDSQRQATHQTKAPGNKVSVLQACQTYLANAKATGSAKTHEDRADTLFDFCFGLPPEFRKKKGGEAEPITKLRKKEMAEKRIHPGYGQLLVADLQPYHLTEWLNAHTTWGGGRRTRVQAVKRALNFAKKEKIITDNPIAGYKVAQPKGRITTITPEQESALYELANPCLARAIRVCIRTGARPGCEFAKVTSRHIVIETNPKDKTLRMEWRFAPKESKTGKERIIRIQDPHLIQLARDQMSKHSDGPIFRNTRGMPWKRESLSLGFLKLKKQLASTEHFLDEDACMYSCRHTYAKRTMQGYWTGKAINIETLARLMGNSPQVCRDHYLNWSEADNEPLWDAC